jgi:endonuclease YncB( thermonuclease family)
MFPRSRKRWRKSRPAFLLVLIVGLAIGLGLDRAGLLPGVISDALQEVATTPELTGPARVIDGDTLEIGRTYVRILMIDAPERDQTCRSASGADWACGQDAGRALRQKIGSLPVRCVGDKHDRYGRVLARCFLGGEDLAAWLVREGHVLATDYYYITDEISARRAKRGIWQGSFERPSDYRAAHPRG